MATKFLGLPPAREAHGRRALAAAIARLDRARLLELNEALVDLSAEPLVRYNEASNNTPVVDTNLPRASLEDCAIAWQFVWHLAPWTLPAECNPFASALDGELESSSDPDRRRLLRHLTETRALFDDSGRSLKRGSLLELEGMLAKPETSERVDEQISVLLAWGSPQVSSRLLGQQAHRFNPNNYVVAGHHRVAVVFAFCRMRRMLDALRFVADLAPALHPLRGRTALWLWLAVVSLVPSWRQRSWLAGLVR